MLEQCPYAYPYAFSTKDTSPYYGGYCCKDDKKRINPYLFHVQASDACDEYIQCNSQIEYGTNGFYCVDAVQDIPTHQIEVYMFNDQEVNLCTQYITSDALEFEDICTF